MDDHDRIRALLADYRAMMDCDTPPQAPDLLRRRMAMANAYRSHIEREGRALMALRTGHPDNPVDRRLDEHSGASRSIFLGYSTLIRDWTPRRIIEQWNDYRRAAREQIGRYEAFLDWEDAAVLPLLDGKLDEIDMIKGRRLG